MKNLKGFDQLSEAKTNPANDAEGHKELLQNILRNDAIIDDLKKINFNVLKPQTRFSLVSDLVFDAIRSKSNYNDAERKVFRKNAEFIIKGIIKHKMG